jgi:hypothetical protein
MEDFNTMRSLFSERPNIGSRFAQRWRDLYYGAWLAGGAAGPTTHGLAQRLAAFCMLSASGFRMRCCLLVGNRKAMSQAKEAEPAPSISFGV